MALDTSILNNTKKILNIPAADAGYDDDVVLWINSAFSHLHSMGVGPAAGYTIEDAEAQWTDFVLSGDPVMINLVKTYVFLRVRLSFDPPQTSYLVTAAERQIAEHEFRLSERRESADWADPDPDTGLTDTEEDIFTGNTTTVIEGGDAG